MTVAPDETPDIGGPGPLVSVIMPAYNSTATLARSIESLGAQVFADWELIIVDDGSTDGTAEMAGEFSRRDPRIRLYQQTNAGPSMARNCGIALARGRWISFLDADDTIAPNCLSALISAQDSDPDADAAACGWARVDTKGVAHNPLIPEATQFAFEWLCRNGPSTHINALLLPRREVLAVGGFDSSLSSCEDWDLWIRLARQGLRFAVVPEPLAFYWQNEESLTKDAARLVRDTLTVRDRCTRPDPRVPCPLPAYAAGLEPSDFVLENLCAAMFWAGASIFAAQSVRDVIAPLQIMPGEIVPDHLLPSFLAGLGLAAGGIAEVVKRWPEITHRAKDLFDAMAERAEQPQLSSMMLEGLKTRLARVHSVNQPVVLDSRLVVPASLHLILGGIKNAPDGVDQVSVQLHRRGQLNALITLPLFGLSAKKLRQALVAAGWSAIEQRATGNWKRHAAMRLALKTRALLTGSKAKSADDVCRDD